MLGLSGDTLSVFGIWMGGALTCAVGALSTNRFVRITLWAAIALFALVAIAVVLTAHKIPWGAFLPLAYAVTPPMVVGIVALMLRSEQRPAVAFLIPDDGAALRLDAKMSATPTPRVPTFDKEQKDFLLQMALVALIGGDLMLFLIVLALVAKR